MKKFLYLLLIGFIAVACTKESEVYYTTTYPVTSLQVSVTFDSEKSTTLTSETIEEDVLSLAPVAVGGYYRLDFSLYNGGTLYVSTAEEAEVITGSFTKMPGSNELDFSFDTEQYTARTTSYTTAEGDLCVVLNVDLTDYYRTKYEDEAIQQVIRHEYTSHIAD